MLFNPAINVCDYPHNVEGAAIQTPIQEQNPFFEREGLGLCGLRPPRPPAPHEVPRPKHSMPWGPWLVVD